jgi:hypothetical protein
LAGTTLATFFVKISSGFDVSHVRHLKPGEPAPATDSYQEHNIFGTPTGKRVDVNECAPMPSAPHSFTTQFHMDAGAARGQMTLHCLPSFQQRESLSRTRRTLIS